VTGSKPEMSIEALVKKYPPTRLNSKGETAGTDRSYSLRVGIRDKLNKGLNRGNVFPICTNEPALFSETKTTPLLLCATTTAPLTASDNTVSGSEVIIVDQNGDVVVGLSV